MTFELLNRKSTAGLSLLLFGLDGIQSVPLGHGLWSTVIVGGFGRRLLLIRGRVIDCVAIVRVSFSFGKVLVVFRRPLNEIAVSIVLVLDLDPFHLVDEFGKA